MQLGLAIELTPGDAALRTCRVRLRVDMDPFHGGQINDEAAIDRRAARDIMAPAAHGDFERQPPRESDSVHDIGYSPALRDQRRPLVDEAVMDAPGLVIRDVSRPEKTPRKRRTSLIHCNRDR
jgi:hypothetical protein